MSTAREAGHARSALVWKGVGLRCSFAGLVKWRVSWATFTVLVGMGCGGAREPQPAAPGGARPKQPAAEHRAPSATASLGSEPSSSERPEPDSPPSDLLRPLRTSKLLEGVRRAGLDPNRLEPWDRVPRQARLKLMDVFSEALDTPCTGCHVSSSDYRAETYGKRVTRKMWDEFVVPLRLGAEPLLCDSCHQGSWNVLDHGKPAAIRAYMEAEYHGRLRVADGSAAECSTCHGEPFEPKIIHRAWGIEMRDSTSPD